MARERDAQLAERMSEHEALMWNIEKDPWLNPNGASIMVLDREMDMDHFRRQMRYGVANTPRLYQRVVPGFARVSTPAWVPDPEFDLDAHIREIVLPAPGSMRQLLDLAARLYGEPLDRTRPLWRFVVVNGLEGGGSAIWAVIHHSVSDGIGQLRMAELYQQASRELTPAPEIDLDAVIADAIAAGDAKESGGNMATNTLGPIRQSASHVLRRQFGIGRRVAGELAMWPADPGRIGDRVDRVVSTVRSAASTLGPGGEESAPGSPLWSERSRHRRLEWVRLELPDLKRAREVFGGTVNDVFLAGLAEAAHRYHVAHDTPIESVNSSFVLSTRSDGKAGGNAFTPVPITLPAGTMSIRERIRRTCELVEEAKDGAQRSGGMTAMSGIANLLPISLVTQTARSAARRIDFSTSNLRGAPFTLFCSGAQVTATIAMGPVAGTGANLTAMSYDGAFHIGVFLDPAAITDPEAFRVAIEESFADMFDEATSRADSTPSSKRAAGPQRSSTTKKAAARKAPTKKTSANKTTSRKASATKKRTTKKASEKTTTAT